MEDELTLPVCFNGKSMEFPARLVQFGYTVKIEVDIEGLTENSNPKRNENGGG